MSNQIRNALIVFVKYPEKGKVKTRLAKSLGAELASSFYKELTENLVSGFYDTNDFKIYIFYSGTFNRNLVVEWLGKSFEYREQSGGNLGERMTDAFRKVFLDGYEKVVIIGSDIPDINLTSVKNSFDDLVYNDIVITPTNDGGYCLLGMKSNHPELFENVEWSSSLVFGTTISKCAESNLSVHVNGKMYDIDTIEDLIGWLGAEGNFEFKSMMKNMYEQIK